MLQAELAADSHDIDNSSLISNAGAIALASKASSSFSTEPLQSIFAAIRTLAVGAGFIRGDGSESGGGGGGFGGGGGGSEGSKTSSGVTACFSARPTFSASDVREGRRAQKCFGALNALANTIENGAIRDVPISITPALLRHIADLKDNIPYELSHRRRFTQGGSGIHTIVLGEECSFDELGKFKPSTFGASSAILISDRASGVSIPYGTHSKCAVIDVLIVYCRFIHSFGLRVRRARCDRTSMERAAEFKEVCAKLQLEVVPAPAEEQMKNPVERTWQTIQNDAAGLLVSQRNLSNDHWFLAICTACTLRACVVNEASLMIDQSMAPWTMLTKWKVDYGHLTSSFFGALATVPRVGKGQLLATRNELCVAICPVFNGSYSHIVLLQGHRTPCIRGGLQLIQEEVVRLKDSELRALEPEYNLDHSVKEFNSLRSKISF